MKRLVSAVLLLGLGALIGVGFAVLTPPSAVAVPCACYCGAFYLGWAPECESGCGFWTDTMCTGDGIGPCGGVCSTQHHFLGCAPEGSC
jgi:hypothetical protein